MLTDVILESLTMKRLDAVQIAEIREIFTLLDKNKASLVSFFEYCSLPRAPNMNQTKTEVHENLHEVDPNDIASFDQTSLISLIARHPKPIGTLDSKHLHLTKTEDDCQKRLLT